MSSKRIRKIQVYLSETFSRLFFFSHALEALALSFDISCTTILNNLHSVCFGNFGTDLFINIITRSKFFFLFIGREPTTLPANNYLQIMVCSCAMPSNCVWLQMIFCSCVKETVLFSFLPSLLRENGGRMIKQFLDEVEQNMVICLWRAVCSQTQLNGIAHEQTIICRQLFAGHVVGSRSMKRKKNL